MTEKPTEAQARRICEALGRDPDDVRTMVASDWPGWKARESAVFAYPVADIPLWRIVQRAAEEE